MSIITFDTAARITQALTSNYSTVMTACTQLQAVGDGQCSTDTEAGLSLAASHIKSSAQGGADAQIPTRLSSS